MNKFTELVVEALTDGSSPEEQKAIYRFYKLYKFIEKTLKRWKFSHIVTVSGSMVECSDIDGPVPGIRVEFECFDGYIFVYPISKEQVGFQHRQDVSPLVGTYEVARSTTVTFWGRWWKTYGGHVLTRDTLFDIFAELYS